MTYLETINKALLNYLQKNAKLIEASVAELDETSVDNSGSCCSNSYSLSFYIKWKKDAKQKHWNFKEVYEDPIEFLLQTLPDYVE